MFLGASLVGDSSSYTVTPSYVDNIKHLTITKGFFDSLTVNKDVNKYNVNSPIPNVWDVSMIMMGDFDGTTSLGALDIDLDQVDAVLVKRREIGTNNPNHDWVIIDYRDLSSLLYDEKLEAINAPQYDNTNRSQAKYEYAVVPLIGADQVTTVSGSVDSVFDGIFLVGADEMWGTIVTDAFINTVRNIEKSYQTTLNRRYPVSMSAAVVNYDSGSVTGEFVPFDEESCQLIYDDDIRTVYQKRFMDFLTDYKAKILKSLDGRIWLVDVTPSPSDNANGIYYRRQVTFNWNEIGSLDSQEDLYYNKMNEVPSKYWGG